MICSSMMTISSFALLSLFGRQLKHLKLLVFLGKFCFLISYRFQMIASSFRPQFAWSSLGAQNFTWSLSRKSIFPSPYKLQKHQSSAGDCIALCISYPLKLGTDVSPLTLLFTFTIPHNILAFYFFKLTWGPHNCRIYETDLIFYSKRYFHFGTRAFRLTPIQRSCQAYPSKFLMDKSELRKV